MPYFILLLLIAVIFIFSGGHQVFNLHPASVHQWRQSDCSAYVKSFYFNHTNLFHPATFNLAGKDGRVASEFPLIYYLSAKLQVITGTNYWITRGLTFVFYIIGLLALLGCIRKWIPQKLYALFPVLILATSPYYYYYALNFLPNIPAISLSFLGLYCFLNYQGRYRLRDLIGGVLSFMLAMLLKPTDGGILLAAFVCVHIYDYFFSRSNKILSRKALIYLALGLLLIILINISWIKYVNWYNDQNGNHQNLIGIYPAWQMDKGLFKYTIKRVITEWSIVFQHKLLLYLIVSLFFLCLFKWRQLNYFLKKITCFLLLGTTGYSVLWFKAYTDHDYYQLPLVLPAVFLAITSVEYYIRCLYPKLNKRYANSIFVLLLMFLIISIFHNRRIQEERYSKPEYVYLNPTLYEIEPYLLNIGITSDDHVVCVPDKSPNSSLNAINRYGYTEAFNWDGYNINNFQKEGAAYLIISDSSYLKNPLYQPFEQKQIGMFKGVYVFDIRNIHKH